MYFNRGELPWQGMRAKTKKEKYQKIMEKKIATTPEELCKTFPGNIFIHLLEEFANFFQYARGLQFEDKPDYNYVRSIFKKVAERYNYEYDFKFDWTIINKQKDKKEETNDNGILTFNNIIRNK